jgi:hypothetical protein
MGDGASGCTATARRTRMWLNRDRGPRPWCRCVASRFKVAACPRVRRDCDPWVAAIALALGLVPATVFTFITGFLLCDWMLSGNIALFQRILGAVVGVAIVAAAILCAMWALRRIRAGRNLAGSVRATLRFLVAGALIGCTISLSVLALLCLFAAFFPE